MFKVQDIYKGHNIRTLLDAANMGVMEKTKQGKRQELLKQGLQATKTQDWASAVSAFEQLLAEGVVNLEGNRIEKLWGDSLCKWAVSAHQAKDWVIAEKNWQKLRNKGIKRCGGRDVADWLIEAHAERIKTENRKLFLWMGIVFGIILLLIVSIFIWWRSTSQSIADVTSTLTPTISDSTPTPSSEPSTPPTIEQSDPGISPTFTPTMSPVPSTNTPTPTLTPSPTETPTSITSPTLTPTPFDAFTAQGPITIAVQENFGKFSYPDALGNYAGFDIDLARELGRRWFSNSDAVKLLPVISACRIPSLIGCGDNSECSEKCKGDEGKADLVIAAMTIREDRKKIIDFSLPYFQDGQRLLVKSESGIRDVCDERLRGKLIAVVSGSTAFNNVQNAITTNCPDSEIRVTDRITNTDGTVIIETNDMAVKNFLIADTVTNTIVAFATDYQALKKYVTAEEYLPYNLTIVDNDLNPNPELYGIGVRKENGNLLELVNLTLKTMKEDGTYAGLYCKYFTGKDEKAPFDFEIPEAIEDVKLEEKFPGRNSQENPKIDQCSAPSSCQPGNNYIVKADDWLSIIAGLCYGDTSLWEHICLAEENKEVIKGDCDIITEGTPIYIPEPPTATLTPTP